MRLLLAGALLAACGCRAPAPFYIRLPDPYTSRGIRVEVTEVVRSGTSVYGVTGTATNTTSDDLEYVSISLVGMDGIGNRIGEATARSDSLKAGASWGFRAMFTSKSVRDLESVLPQTVVTVPAPR